MKIQLSFTKILKIQISFYFQEYSMPTYRIRISLQAYNPDVSEARQLFDGYRYNGIKQFN